MFSEDRAKAVELLRKYMNEHHEDKCLENDEKYRMTDPEVRSYFAGHGVAYVNGLKQLEKSRREDIINLLLTYAHNSV